MFIIKLLLTDCIAITAIEITFFVTRPITKLPFYYNNVIIILTIEFIVKRVPIENNKINFQSTIAFTILNNRMWKLDMRVVEKEM